MSMNKRVFYAFVIILLLFLMKINAIACDAGYIEVEGGNCVANYCALTKEEALYMSGGTSEMPPNFPLMDILEKNSDHENYCVNIAVQDGFKCEYYCTTLWCMGATTYKCGKTEECATRYGFQKINWKIY